MLFRSQQGIAGLQALGAQDQALEQQKLNQLALGAQQGYQLPVSRIQDVANIYGGIAGAMPGSPTQKFQATPLVSGIGGGLDAATIMGMFGGQNTQPQQQTYMGSTGYTGNPAQMNMRS